MADEGDLVAPRLQRGCRCFVARWGGEVAGYGWLSTGAEWIGEVGLEIRPGPGETYVWNCVTLPAHRLRGCFRTLLLHLTATARREGLSRLWIGSVDGGAEAALVGAGFRPVLRILVVDLPGIRWLAVRGVAGAGPALVAAAHESLGAGRGRLRSGLRRPRRRRH
jgi:GNAT superfamily N-acetyltransferase